MNAFDFARQATLSETIYIYMYIYVYILIQQLRDVTSKERSTSGAKYNKNIEKI